MSKLKKDHFAPLLGTWWSKFEKFFDNGGFEPIYDYLKKESLRGKKIAPNSNLVYRCFQETPINECYCVLISMCPYHSFVNNSPVADGLAFSCGITEKLQPSLDAVYKGWECEFHDCLNLGYNKNPDLGYLARSGVLLYNCALTTELGKAGNHIPIWSDFTKYFLEEVIAYTGIPIVFIGKDAQKFNKYVTPLTHGQIYNIEHPAAAARESRDWNTEGVFKKVSEIIWLNNRKKIKWLDEYEN